MLRRATSWFRQPGLPLLIPFAIAFLLFWVVPLIGGLRMSLYSNSLFEAPTFVGLSHYRDLLFKPALRDTYLTAIKNTAVYTSAILIIVIPLALVLAQSLRMSFRRFRPLLTFMLLIPGLTPPAVLAILFHLVFHGKEGVLNNLFVVPFGFEWINWMRDPKFILPAFVLMAVWRWTGLVTFFILAGMEAIPVALFEAAHLETNSRWRVFWSVTLPQLRPVLLFTVVYLAVDAVAQFSGSYVLLGGSGGARDAGLLLVNFTYRQAFSNAEFGTAAAITFSIAPFMLLALWLCFFMPRRQQASK